MTKYIVLFISLFLLSGCLKSTEQSSVDRKNELIVKYEGKIPVNLWEKKDKEEFLKLIGK
jgi:uncharacterized protein YcfL